MWSRSGSWPRTDARRDVTFTQRIRPKRLVIPSIRASLVGCRGVCPRDTPCWAPRRAAWHHDFGRRAVSSNPASTRRALLARIDAPPEISASPFESGALVSPPRCRVSWLGFRSAARRAPVALPVSEDDWIPWAGGDDSGWRSSYRRGLSYPRVVLVKDAMPHRVHRLNHRWLGLTGGGTSPHGAAVLPPEARPILMGSSTMSASGSMTVS